MAEQLAFIDALKKYDPEFYEVVIGVRTKAKAPGALDAKTKTLISLALDTAAGAVPGVRSLAKQARALGASDDEIRETLRLVYSGRGNVVLVAAMAAFEEK